MTEENIETRGRPSKGSVTRTVTIPAALEAQARNLIDNSLSGAIQAAIDFYVSNPPSEKANTDTLTKTVTLPKALDEQALSAIHHKRSKAYRLAIQHYIENHPVTGQESG